MKNKTEKSRCLCCRMDLDLCICAFIVPTQTETRLELLIHAKELPKSSNTGHLAAKMLTNSRLSVRKYKADSEVWQRELIEKARAQSATIFFLCHDAEAVPLDEVLEELADRKQNEMKILAVVDGTWNQAHQVITHELSLLAPFKVKFSDVHPNPISNLWREPLPGGLATIEAIWYALLALEPSADLTALKNLMTIRSQRIKWIRGLLSEEEVSGGIPLAARGKKNIAG